MDYSVPRRSAVATISVPSTLRRRDNQCVIWHWVCNVDHFGQACFELVRHLKARRCAEVTTSVHWLGQWHPKTLQSIDNCFKFLQHVQGSKGRTNSGHGGRVVAVRGVALGYWAIGSFILVDWVFGMSTRCIRSLERYGQ
jgi:hypothetical protein